jgi:hypothetical protein
MPRLGIGIFHDDQTCTGVPYHHGHLPLADAAARDQRRNLGGEFIGPLAARGDLDAVVLNLHVRSRS